MLTLSAARDTVVASPGGYRVTFRATMDIHDGLFALPTHMFTDLLSYD